MFRKTWEVLEHVWHLDCLELFGNSGKCCWGTFRKVRNCMNEFIFDFWFVFDDSLGYFGKMGVWGNVNDCLGQIMNSKKFWRFVFLWKDKKFVIFETVCVICRKNQKCWELLVCLKNGKYVISKEL